MATMRVNGIDLAAAQLDQLGRPMIRKIVEAGAGAAEKRMIEDTRERRHIRNSDMLDAIGLPKDEVCTFCWTGKE